jgi:hypothetical protein
VTFYVTVPGSARDTRRAVFLAGSLHRFSPNLPDWDPHGLEMKKIDDRHWSITLMGQENIVIEYKYTLGDWDHSEKDSNCADIPNRLAVIKMPSSGPLTLHDVVENWGEKGKDGS